VELLVVIGIIALLISILMPAISRAREHAITAQCLSNIRQVGMAIQMYANAHNDRVPVGYNNGQGWNGYVVYEAGNYYTLMGKMILTGEIKEPEAFFCPAQKDPRFQYKTAENPWPWPTPVAGKHHRAGYTVRPSTNWSGPQGWPARNTIVRLSRIKGRAMVADIVGIPLSSPDYTVLHHKKINVLYGDRSAQSIQFAEIEPIQRQIQALSNPPVSLYINDNTPTTRTQIWNVFDNTK
jgi:type II secretory pathway pseudopilin PulG